MKVVIIGGVAGGATAAARLRRLDESAEIVVLERSGYVSYANCGLPYYVGGIIKDKSALTLKTPEDFYERFRVDVRVKNEVTAINPEKKTVTVRRLEDMSEYEESYDKLILSPGAKAIQLPLPGADSEKIMTLRTVEDVFRIREYLEENNPKTAVVIGGGFIGLEAAENLMHYGVKTILFQNSPHVMPNLDYDIASQVNSYLRSKGLDLRLNKSVNGFIEENGKITVTVENSESVSADLVIMAVGVVPETHLAENAGLKLGIKKAIVVNEHMETSVSDIYAVGDAVQIKNFVTGEDALISLAGPANKQGRIAADNICGIRSEYTGGQGSSVIKLFDMTVASTGINEKNASELGLEYDKAVTYSASHATYYPGATDMTIKTIYVPSTGKILGAQIVGFEGVDKRIDVMAAAIRGGMTSVDLEELELSYAPPFSSAKDPVNMVGYVIENLRSGLVKQHHWHDVEKLIGDDSVILLDTRTVGEYRRGRIPGSVNIPLDSLRERLGELDKSKKIYVNCFSGLRSYIACRILTQNGFDCSNLSGGFRYYEYIAGDKAYDEEPTHPCGIKCFIFNIKQQPFLYGCCFSDNICFFMI